MIGQHLEIGYGLWAISEKMAKKRDIGAKK